MNMTPEQRATFKTSIVANQQTGQPLDGVTDEQVIANYYNAASAFIVWRTLVAWDTIMTNGMDWTRCDNLSVGKTRIWEWMFRNAQNAIDPSKPNVRAGIDATWVGTGADLAVRAAVYVHCKRPATRFEQLYVTGTGSDAAPGTMALQGNVSAQDVSDTLAS